MSSSTMQTIHVASEGSNSAVLQLTEQPLPKLSEPFDILVRVKGIGLNPVDTKVRKTKGKVLGYDASGVVEAAGSTALFQPGDEVMYAGSIGRPGSNAQFQLVDSRIVARKPRDLAWDDAAAIPLVGLTAWEMLEEQFHIVPNADNSDKTLIVVNAAGGVGTMAVFLASKVFNIKRIIATASRPETIEWVKKFGATDVINHRQPLATQLAAIDAQPSHALICFNTPHYVEQLTSCMRPFGHMGSIVEWDEMLVPLRDPAFFRALTFSWEFMFAKTMFNYNVESQGKILTRLSELAEQGVLPSLVTVRKELSVAALRECHDLQESGKAFGKIAFTVPEKWI